MRKCLSIPSLPGFISRNLVFQIIIQVAHIIVLSYLQVLTSLQNLARSLTSLGNFLVKESLKSLICLKSLKSLKRFKSLA